MPTLDSLEKIEGSTRKAIYSYDWSNRLPEVNYDWYFGGPNFHTIDLTDIDPNEPGEQFHTFVSRLSHIPIDGANNTDNPRAYHRNVIARFPKASVKLLGAGVDLGRTGYKQPLRWNKLIDDYLPLNFFEEAGKKKIDELNQGVFFFGRRTMRHSHGPCLLTFSFGRQGTTLNITVNSRTAYVIPVGVFDYTLIHLMAQDMTRRYRVLDSYQLTWHLNQFQWRVWTMIPYIENTGLEEMLHEDSWISRRLPWAREDPQVQEHVENSSYQMFNNWTGPRKQSAIENPVFMPTRLRRYGSNLYPSGMPQQDEERFDGHNPHPSIYFDDDFEVEWDVIFAPIGRKDPLAGSWVTPKGHPYSED